MTDRSKQLQATRQTILDLLNSMGPCCVLDIISECKEQAYAGMIPLAINQLVIEQAIYFDHDSGTFDTISD
jgi:hypothetical protein